MSAPIWVTACSGFHALEYMLFENGAPAPSGNHTFPQSWYYLVGVANDLCNMCVRLEASWAAGQCHRREADDPGRCRTADFRLRRASMRNWGRAAASTGNYKDAAEEIISGLHRHRHGGRLQKIGCPANGTSLRISITSSRLYSQNSKTDFIDNIISIRNTYQGMTSGDASVSD